MQLTTRTVLGGLGRTAAIACVGIGAQAASAAEFNLLLTEGSGTDVPFEQRWNDPTIWSLVSGVDDGADGIPNGLDTIVMDRTPLANGNTDLSNEGLPNHSLAKLTGTGAGGRDIVLKFTGVLTLGDLELLASPDTFHIEMERDTDFNINGVISGAGDLLISRASSFSTTEPGEEIRIEGSAANTITGSVRLFNSNGGGQPSFFVADKVGAFGQASTLTLEGVGGGGVTSLQLTANTLGGEGAIDDDATSVVLGTNGAFDVDAGVNEDIGFGLLTVDGLGVIAPGTYDSSESWINGAGTVTVIPEPTSLALLGLGGLLVARRRR